MYARYTTRGYVLGYYNQGESDRRYRIATSDAGVIDARAISVRKESSKLKHFLQKLNCIELEFIQSKRGYQVVGGKLLGNTWQDMAQHDQQSRADMSRLLARMAHYAARLSQTGDADVQLYTLFEQTIAQLHSADTCSEHIYTVELWSTARLLMALGYFDPNFSADIPRDIFVQSTLSSENISMLSVHATDIQRYIDQCLDYTML